MQKDKLFSTLHFHFIVVIFGFTAILGALISISAIPLVWYRMTMATIGLGLMLWLRKHNFRLDKTITWVASNSRGYNIGKLLSKNKISACYVESGIDATAGCAELIRK